VEISKKQFFQLIREFRFRELFNELGWDNVKRTEPVAVGEDVFHLEAVAEKRGFLIFVCRPGDAEGGIPNYNVRNKIDNVVAKLCFEHLVIYTDSSETRQIWQLVIREPGKPAISRETKYYAGQEPELLFQRLKGLFFAIDEEDNIRLVDVTRQVTENLSANADKVTKKFYAEFKKHHTAFIGFIRGIDNAADRDWYASLMLNRLMFVYFIQKKGFLDKDKDYLGSRLRRTRENRGKDKFYKTFYRGFLLTLFHEGLGAPDHSPELEKEIGRMPYLNGGLFEVHQLEAEYTDTDIDDKAFEHIFGFFDQYEWHLDTRIMATGNEINPDVIGYIFEKYINDRAAMGAYYTKEDITEYIAKNCIIPFLFDEVGRKYSRGVSRDADIWDVLKNDPDKYIYDAVRHGTDRSLPEEIEAGIMDVSRRDRWNTRAPSDYGLPTEIWRETVERRNRYSEIREKIEMDEITEISDFITYNLNIRQFAQDALKESADPKFIRHFYKALTKITVLDPTCGSGAFLFAAMNILEDLYEGCLERMEKFTDEAKKGKHRSFENWLAEIKSSDDSDRKYFVYKSVILKNLYGVDMMKEAVEIAKLRLFLKLAACADADYDKPNLGLEPLPDIDFNIRSGNTLVGFATEDELDKIFSTTVDGYLAKPAIVEKMEMAAMAFDLFKRNQLSHVDSFQSLTEGKDDLKKKLDALNQELNLHLSKEYGVNHKKKGEYGKWLRSHQPFHWFAEFYEILHDRGGFDVIIGNPPYVEYSKVKKDYVLKCYKTLTCGNLYAFVLERNFFLLDNFGRTGMIVPHSVICTDRMNAVQNQLTKSGTALWVSTYCIRPAKLFTGADQRLAIYLSKQEKNTMKPFAVNSSRYHHWYKEFRPYLFNLLQYADISNIHFANSLIKAHSAKECALWNKLKRFSKLNKQLSAFRKGEAVYFHNSPRYWIRTMNFAPYFWNERDGEQISTQVKMLSLKNQADASVVVATLNSSLFFWWFAVLSDCRHLNLREIENFPAGLDRMSQSVRNELAEISDRLVNDLTKHARRKKCCYKTTGNVAYDEFYPAKSKPIIDEIDKVLARHYGFSDEELDFIINYDIKYRMGKKL